MPQNLPQSTSEARRQQIAQLLAAGLLRFHRRVQRPLFSSPESAADGLDDPAETGLMVTRGSAGEEVARTGERKKS